MKQAWRRFGFILRLLTFGSLLSLLGCGKATPIYRGKLHGTEIVVFTKSNAKSLLSVHADRTKVLQIGRLQFEDVRGAGSGFTEIEEWRTLVFVTEEDSVAFIHAFDLKRNVDTKARLGDASGFGYWLGSSNTQYQTLSVLASNKLLLSIIGPSYPERKQTKWEFTFDLERKSVFPSGKREL